MTKFIAMKRRAEMPGNCMGAYDYYNVGVVEVDPDKLPEGREVPAMLSTRSKGVVRIVKMKRKVHVGKTYKSSGYCAWQEMQELADSLNKERSCV